MVHSDEISMRVGESRGYFWVTRLLRKVYREICLDIRYRGYTEIMFWDCYTSECVVQASCSPKTSPQKDTMLRMILMAETPSIRFNDRS